MNVKKIFIIIVCAIILIAGIILWGYFNRDEEVINNVQEIVPEQEILDEQLRNTVVSLYFINSENGEVEVESRLIDAKKLMVNPYNELINLWIAGPNSNKYKTNCSKDVKINNIEFNNNCVTIDFSNDFIDGFSRK